MWMLSNSINGSSFRLCLLLVSEHWCPHRYKILLRSDTGYFKYRSTIWCSRTSFRLRSDMAPEHGTRERFLMSTNVNTPFFKYPGQNWGTVSLPEYKVSPLYSVLNWAMIYRVLSV